MVGRPSGLPGDRCRSANPAMCPPPSFSSGAKRGIFNDHGTRTMKSNQPRKGAAPEQAAPPPNYPTNHRPVHLATLASFQAGLQVRTYQIRPDGPIDIIRTRDIVKGHLRYELECAKIRDFPKNHALQVGDVVLQGHYGTFTPIVMDEHHKPIACASPLVFIRIQDKAALLPEYVAWYLRTSEGHQTLAAYEKADRKPAFATIEGLYAIQLPKPSPEVQRLVSGVARLLREFQEYASATGLTRISAKDAETFDWILCRLAQF